MVEYKKFSNGGVIYCTATGLTCNDKELVRIGLRRAYDEELSPRFSILDTAYELGIRI